MTREESALRFDRPGGIALTGFVWPALAALEAPAPTVVFSPGNGFPVQAYRPVLQALPPDTPVHALNPRGHGGSTVPPGPGDGSAPVREGDRPPPAPEQYWDDMLADLRAYVERHTLPPVILAGHSMGAMLSLRLAAEAPHLASGLLLLEPPLRLRPGEAIPEAELEPRRAFIDRARNRRAAWASREEAAAWFAGSVVYRLWDPEARAGFLAAGLAEAPGGGVTLATPPWLEADIYEGVPQQALYEWAWAAPCAGALVRGQDSVAANAAAFEALAEALPVGVVLPAPGTHTFPMEHPHETAQRLLQGLRLLRGETGLALK